MWVKPPGFDDDKESGGKDNYCKDATKNTKVEDTAAMSSVAEKRKKTWFKPLKEKADEVEEKVVEKSPVEEVKQTAVPEKKATTKEVEQGDNAANTATTEKEIQQNTEAEEVSQTY